MISCKIADDNVTHPQGGVAPLGFSLKAKAKIRRTRCSMLDGYMENRSLLKDRETCLAAPNGSLVPDGMWRRYE
jgi:ribosomal protein L18E